MATCKIKKRYARYQSLQKALQLCDPITSHLKIQLWERLGISPSRNFHKK
jgi:hypothetical protein